MAVDGGTQALIATFFFGLVALAASSIALLFTYTGRHLRNNFSLISSPRLVLLIFFLASALWSIMEFAATLISGDSVSACQAVIAFAAGFDQLARLSFEQFLVWGVKPKHSSKAIFFLQASLIIRFIVGGVLIGVQRPQIHPVCVAKNILLGLGIAALAMDAFISGVIFFFIFIYGRSNSSGIQQISGGAPAKILTFLTAGFAAWTATSIPRILGVEGFPLAARTVVPAIGLLMLLGLLVLFRSYLQAMESETRLPPASDKVDINKPLPSKPVDSRDLGASPEVFQRPWGGARLHSSKPSNSENEYLPARAPSSKKVGSATPVIDKPTQNQTERGINGDPAKVSQFATSSTNEAPNQTDRGFGGGTVEVQFATSRTKAAPFILQKPPKKPKQSLKGGKLKISNPLISESSNMKIMDEIPTIDLSEASRRDQERRARQSGNGSRNQKPVNSIYARPESLKRKEIPYAVSVPDVTAAGSYLSANAAMTTAAQVSPRMEEMRRRSPHVRQLSSDEPIPPLASKSSPLKQPSRPPRSPLEQVPLLQKSPLEQASLTQKSPLEQVLLPQKSPFKKYTLPQKSPLDQFSSSQKLFLEQPSLPQNSSLIPISQPQRSTSKPPSRPPRSPLKAPPRPPRSPSKPPTRPPRSPLKRPSQPQNLPLLQPSRPPRSPPKQAEAARSMPVQIPSKKMRPGRSVLRDNTNVFMDPSTPPAIPISFRDEKISRPSLAAAKSVLAPRIGPRSKPGTALAKPYRNLASASTETPTERRTVNGYTPNTRTQMISRQFQGSRGQDRANTTKSLGKPPTSRSSFTGSIVNRPRPIPRKSSIYKAKYRIRTSQRLSRQDSFAKLQRKSLDFSSGSDSDSESSSDSGSGSGSKEISNIPTFPQPPKSAGASDDWNFIKTSDKTITSPGSFDEVSSIRTSLFADTAPVSLTETDSATAVSSFVDFDDPKYVESNAAYASRRQSSPVLPVEDLKLIASADTGPPPLEEKTLVSARRPESNVSTASLGEDDRKEVVPLVLDTESQHVFSTSSDEDGSAAQPAEWHRRVGDACPTFSDRKNGSRSPTRRVVAPVPLLLGRNTKSRVAEAPPLESPQHALDKIQEQLMRLNETDAESVKDEDAQRRTLLANIEAEMGAQESHWQDIRRNLSKEDHRSPSSIKSSASPLPSGGVKSTWLQSSDSSPAAKSPDPKLDVLEPKTLSDETFTAPRDDVVSYNTADTGRHAAAPAVGDVKITAEDGRPQQQDGDALLPTAGGDASSLGSTAPEERGESEREVGAYKSNNYGTRPVPIYISSSAKTAQPTSHWSIDSDTVTLASETLQQIDDVPEVPGVPDFERGLNRPKLPLDRSYFGGQSSGSIREELLSSAAADSKPKPPRPVTQRPPRRSKRITALPDIPEDPKPLANKRNALGFFQFPWGETSDIATLQTKRSGPYSVPSEVYPSSFFDFYEDEDEEEDSYEQALGPDSDESAGGDGGYSDESNEEFDDTTLWEIASLLHSNEIPSRDSLFPVEENYRPPSRVGIVADDETIVFAVSDLPEMEFEESTVKGGKYEMPRSIRNSATLWNSGKDTSSGKVSRRGSLVQPDDVTWKGYVGAQTEAETLRVARRMSKADPISSTSLWTMSEEKMRALVEEKDEVRRAAGAASALWKPGEKVAATAPPPPPPASSIGPGALLPASLSSPTESKSGKQVASANPELATSSDGGLPLWSKSRAAAPLPAEPAADGLWSVPHRQQDDDSKTTTTMDVGMGKRVSDATVGRPRVDSRPLVTLDSASHSLWSKKTTTAAEASEASRGRVNDWLALSTTEAARLIPEEEII